jgi:phosphoglycolate phosphatase
MKLALFDLDGTLVSTGGAGIRALDRAFEEIFGLERAMEGVKPAGKTDPQIMREVIAVKMGREAREGEIDKICEAYLKFLPREVWFSGDYRTFPGTEACLKALQEAGDILIGLGTGNLEQGARIKLEPSGLNSYFPFGGFGSDAEDRAELLKIGLSRASKSSGHSISLKDVVVIGDTVLDIQAARRAGMRAAAVAAGHGNPDELARAQPDLLLKDFTEHAALLRFLRNGG